MLHFLYTYSEHTPKGGHTTKTVRIYRIKRNTPRQVAVWSETFVSEFQLVMMALEVCKLLPKAAFVRTPSNSYKYAYAYSLEAAGIARITRVV